jgi:excisionase family DNA binding protein
VDSLSEKPTPRSIDKLSYRIPEAVAATGIGRSTLYDMIKAGELETRKVRGITLITRSELERLVYGSKGAPNRD